jgi:2-aminoadipate transaminase
VDDRLDAIQRRTAGDPRVIGLAGGLPSEAQFPKRELARSFLRVLEHTGTPALQYGWAEGFESLRELVASRLRARGAPVSAGDVIVTSGAQQAIAIALEALCKPGDRVGVAPETYPAALDLLRERRLLPVVSTTGVRAHYAMPAVGNPSGVGLDARTRAALLAGGAPVIEDDAYADLRFGGAAPRPLLAEAPKQVFHVGTLSKTLCPGLRIGWLVAPAHFRKRSLRIKQGSDLHASSLAQAIVADLLGATPGGGGLDFEARLVRLRRFYRARAAALGRALRTHLPGWHFSAPEGGFAIWARADLDPSARSGRRGVAEKAFDEKAFLEAAAAEGVMVDPGSMFRANRSVEPMAIRLCFSAAPPAKFEEAVRRLARAWRRVRRDRLVA